VDANGSSANITDAHENFDLGKTYLDDRGVCTTPASVSIDEEKKFPIHAKDNKPGMYKGQIIGDVNVGNKILAEFDVEIFPSFPVKYKLIIK